MSQSQSPSASGRSDTRWAQRGVAIGSLVLAILMPVVGLVGSIVSLVWAKRIGAGTKLPAAGIVVSIIMIILGVVLGIIAFVMFTNAVNAGALNLEALCSQRSQWGWLLDSLRYVCR